MKSLTTKLMIAAAALVAAGSASAQVLKADVPFAFQANGKTMAAGVYQVHTTGSRGVMTIRGKHSVALAVPLTGIDAKEASAKLVFSCSRGGCALAQVWTGTAHGLVLATPKWQRKEEATLTVIPLRPNADE
jgi:hypothetical protein